MVTLSITNQNTELSNIIKLSLKHVSWKHQSFRTNFGLTELLKFLVLKAENLIKVWVYLFVDIYPSVWVYLYVDIYPSTVQSNLSTT